MPAPISPPISVQPQLNQLKTLVEYVERFAEAEALSTADAYALTLAAEELFVNTIEHGKPPATMVNFTLTCGEEAAIAVYADDAGEYDSTLLPAPNTTLGAQERAIGGLGIHLVRTMMQSVVYERREGWNRLTCTRKLKG